MISASSLRRQSLLERTLGAAVAALGVAVLLGWLFDIATLKSLVPGRVTIKPNTAVAFVACGLALALFAGTLGSLRRLLVLAVAAAVALIGGLSLAEEVFSRNLGIDEWLFKETVGSGTVLRPGRMSPATAQCLLSLAAALAMLTLPLRSRMQLPLAAALSASVAIVSALFLVGHASDIWLSLGWSGSNAMGIYSASGLLALGVALLIRARRMHGTKWTVDRPDTIGFVAGVALMLVSAQLAAIFAQQMASTTAGVVGTQQVLQRLQEIRTDLRIIESSQRGHLLLGDESLLASRETQKAAVRTQLSALRSAPPGDAPPAAALEDLRQAIDERFAFGEQLIESRRTQGFEPARALLMTGRDEALTNRIAGLIAPMIQRERSRLAERQARLADESASTFLLLPVSTFLGLTAMLGGLFFLEQGSSRRRRAEEALAASRAHLRVVFDSMSEGVRVIDRSRRVVQSNAAGASFHGLITSADSVGEIQGQLEALTPSGEVLPPTAWPGVRALAGDFVRDFELTMRRRDNGRFVVLEVNTALLSGEADKSGDIVITTHDITARKIAEQARGVSQRRLAGVIENLSEGLLIHGLDHDLVHMNRAALALYELPPTAKTTTSLRTFSEKFELATLDGAALAREDWPIARLLRGQPVNAIELRVRRRDRPGWERLFSYGGAVLHEPGAEPIVFVTVTDVTARRTAEKQLQKFNVELEQRVVDRTDQLQAKTRELEGFCYAISHDLKAPLRGIDGYSRLLSVEYGDQLDADGKKFIGNVRKAAAQMNRLIEDLLAYSKQERRTMVPSRIRLREFVVAKLQRHAADLTGVKLSVDVEDLRVRADREGLDMALRNLIDNAVKFSARSQPPEIAIRSQVIGDRCVLSVSDNGTGFDMRYHDKIFEIFQRLHLAEDYPGTGVGLALVHKAMERMGGRVWAEGEPGVGATFHLELEITDEADGPETAY